MNQAEYLRFIHLLLQTPTEDSLGVLIESITDLPELQPALAELSTLSLEQWQAEHTRLFINGYPKTIAPPFASVYLEGQQAGSIAQQLSEFYAQIQYTSEIDLPSDYLGHTLEVFAIMVEQNALETEAANYLLSIANRWIPLFSHDLIQSKLKIYQLVAIKLKEWFNED